MNYYNPCDNCIRNPNDCIMCMTEHRLDNPFPYHIQKKDVMDGIMKPEDLKIWNRRLRGYHLMAREAYFDTPPKCINLGCGNIILKGFTNVDYIPRKGGFKLDLFKPPWDLPKDNYEYILASQIMEHIPHVFPGYEGEGFFLFMKEVFRIAKDGAIFEVQVPNPFPFYFYWATLPVGHTRLVNDRCFRTWHKKGISTDGQRTDAEQYGRLEPLLKRYNREFKLGPISDVHIRKYLGIEVGFAKTLVLVFRIHKGEDL